MKKIKNIKKGMISRNASLAKYAFRTGLSFLKKKNDPKDILQSIIGVDAKKFVDEISYFKGSVTKAGQLISQYGEYYLSPQINEKLKLLQTSTHFLDFEKIKDQIPEKAFLDLDIHTEPLAAASIGQVHQAFHKDNNKEYVLKIQYHGIEKAIKSDLRLIKFFVDGIKMVPKGVDTTDVFNQIESVLRKEMDYERERKVLLEYKTLLNDNFYYVPKVLKKYSNKKVICLEFIDGFPLSDISYENSSREKVNKLGEKIFELFLKEIFELNLVQTDAHGGNYYVNEDLDKLFLLDFGACLDFEEEVLNFYRGFLKYSYLLDENNFFKTLENFISFSEKSLTYDRSILWEYMSLASSPLRSYHYHWGETKILDELFALGSKLRKSLKFDSVPSQFIFLDRKVMGVFTLLRKLKSEFNVDAICKKYLV